MLGIRRLAKNALITAIAAPTSSGWRRKATRDLGVSLELVARDSGTAPATSTCPVLSPKPGLTGHPCRRRGVRRSTRAALPDPNAHKHRPLLAHRTQLESKVAGSARLADQRPPSRYRHVA